MDILTQWDLILAPFYILFILLISNYIKNIYISQNPAYKYYVIGIGAKIIGAITLCLIYTLYYKGGDTTGYFSQAQAISNLIYKTPGKFLEIIFIGNSAENYTYFDATTGYMDYHTWTRDDSAIFISRITSPLCFLGFRSFICTTILLAWICYSGIWKLYLLFCENFPDIRRQLAIAILFIPSVVFWGSGLLKDTITISAVGWYTYSLHRFFILKKRTIFNGSGIVAASFLLLAIKPYILFALLPGSIIWLSDERIAKMPNKILRVIATPFILILSVGLGYVVLSQLGSYLGEYSLDTVLDRAVVVQQDLKQDYYHGHSFDIGDFEPTIAGVASKAHLAIAATLFRPTLLDAKTPVMFVSALENTYILIITLFLVIRLKFFGFFNLIRKNPLLFFSVLFSLFFAFSVGLTTSNFGALVRLRIPCLPFYVSSLFVIKYFYDKKSDFKVGS